MSWLLHSYWAPAGAADAVRMGLRRQAHQRPDGLSAATHGSGNDEASAPKTQSGRAAAWSAHALRLALRHEANRHEDAGALRSMFTTAKGFAGRAGPMGFHPTDYVDITAVRENKKAALFAHKSQNGEEIYRHHEMMEELSRAGSREPLRPRRYACCPMPGTSPSISACWRFLLRFRSPL
jgi:hypothetical protein